MPTICAWCDPPRQLSQFPLAFDTHGICPKCKKLMCEVLEKRYRRGKQKMEALHLKRKAE